MVRGVGRGKRKEKGQLLKSLLVQHKAIPHHVSVIGGGNWSFLLSPFFILSTTPKPQTQTHPNKQTPTHTTYRRQPTQKPQTHPNIYILSAFFLLSSFFPLSPFFFLYSFFFLPSFFILSFCFLWSKISFCLYDVGGISVRWIINIV